MDWIMSPQIHTLIGDQTCEEVNKVIELGPNPIRLVSLYKEEETPESFLPVDTGKKSHKPRRELSPEMKFASTLTMDS